MIPRGGLHLVVPPRLDVLAAVVVVVLGVGEVAAGQLHGPVGLGYASVAAYAGCLCLRRSSLWAAVLVAFATVVVTYAWGLSQQDYLASILACLVLVAWAGYVLPLLEALLAGGYSLVCVAATNNPTNVGNDAWLLLVIGGAWLAGRALQSRRLLIDDLQRTAVELEQSRQELAMRAVAEERLRIAREIHDVLAHSVTVMLVQAEAAERVLPQHAEARQAVAAVQETGRQAIADLRQLLGVLRPGPSASGVAPQPGLGELPDLVTSYQGAGLTVRHHLQLGEHALPPTLELTAYRVVQEALTNVLRHSEAELANVDIDTTPSGLRVEITDPGPAKPHQAPSGHGLEGMRERLAASGGILTAGPHAGGFKVSATLPLDPI